MKMVAVHSTTHELLLTNVGKSKMGLLSSIYGVDVQGCDLHVTRTLQA